jgi:hypothetical protein
VTLAGGGVDNNGVLAAPRGQAAPAVRAVDVATIDQVKNWDLRLLRSVVADVHSYAAAYAQSLTAPEQIVAAFAAAPIGRG